MHESPMSTNFSAPVRSTLPSSSPLELSVPARSCSLVRRDLERTPLLTDASSPLFTACFHAFDGATKQPGTTVGDDPSKEGSTLVVPSHKNANRFPAYFEDTHCVLVR